MSYIIAFIIGYIGYDLFLRIQSYINNKKIEALNSEDKKLKEKQIELGYEISQIKKDIEKPIEKLNSEEIEKFWKDKKWLNIF